MPSPIHLPYYLLLMSCLWLSHSLSAQSPLLDSLRQRVVETIETPQQVKALTDLAWYLKEAHLLGEAESYGWEARHLADRYQNRSGQGNAWNVLGLVAFRRGEYEYAIQLLDSAYEAFTEMHDSTGRIAVLINQGQLHGSLGNCLPALASFQEATQLLLHQPDPFRRLVALRINHALTLLNCYQYHTALSLSKQIMAEIDSAGFKRFTGTIYHIMGVAEYAIKDYEASLATFVQGEMEMLAQGDTESAAILLANQGMVHVALHHYEKAIAIFEETNARRGEVRYNDGIGEMNLGIALAKVGRFDEAIALIEPATAAIEERGEMTALPTAYKGLAETYAGMGQHVRAYESLMQALVLTDSLKDLQIIARVQELNAGFETQRMAYQLDRAAWELQLQEQRIWQLTSLLIGTILIATLVYLLLFIRNRRRRYEVQRRQIELEYSVLRTQMNPHFIFNALNSIQGFFAERDFVSGNEYLGAFGMLMRRVLEQSTLPVISLEEDLDTLNLYLQLEKARLQQQFSYSFELASDLDPSDFDVPPMMLQPFVENAIWHGIAPKPTPGHLIIRVAVSEDEKALLVEIEDDGVGLTNKPRQRPQAHRSKGVQITRERLGKHGEVRLIPLQHADGRAKGTLVRLQVPLH